MSPLAHNLTLAEQAAAAFAVADEMVAIAQRNRAQHLVNAGIDPTQPE